MHVGARRNIRGVLACACFRSILIIVGIHLRLALAVLAGVLFAHPGHGKDLRESLASIRELPPHVQFRAGEKSYVADYSAAENGTVPIYVVNATAGPVEHGLFMPWMFRETLSEEGVWRRCEPFPQIVDGVGLDETMIIPRDQFLVFHAARDSSRGTRQKVRFRMYTTGGPLPEVTNIGEGLVDPEDVRSSAMDVISALSGSFADLAGLFAGKEALPAFPYRDEALRRLGTLIDEPQRVAVLKEVIRMAKATDDVDAFRLALVGLRREGANKWTGNDFWNFTVKELSGGQLRWAYAAYAELLQAPVPEERKRVLLEEIIDRGRHPLFKAALLDYPRLAGNAPATALIERILRSSRYDAASKQQARALGDRLQMNPFLAVSVMPGELDAQGRKTVAISVVNIADAPVTLRAADPLSLLAVSVADPSGRELPSFQQPRARARWNEEGLIQLEPREVHHFPAVHWWAFVDVRKIPPDTGLQLAVRVRTPGLWPSPAAADPVQIPPASVNAARESQLAEFAGTSGL
jgi:hypothetical protein